MSDEAPLVYVYGRGDVIPDNVIKINVTSRSSSDWSKKLSPMHLGPIDIFPFDDDEAYSSKTMENAWQYLKFYPEQTKETWLSWAKQGWNNEKAVRYPFGRARKPLYSLWKGDHLGYIEARFKIYAPLYAECVEKYAKSEYDKIKDILDNGNSIGIGSNKIPACENILFAHLNYFHFSIISLVILY